MPSGKKRKKDTRWRRTSEKNAEERIVTRKNSVGQST